jgi:two-component system, OmpR family, response regulator
VAIQVLVVDDEQGIRDLVHDALSLAGFEVTKAADGLEALALLRKQKWDLCILDINLPKVDGFTLLEKLRESDKQTPILLLSARGESVDVTHGLKLGADDYVKKPFGLEELVLRVRALLRRTTQEGPTNLILAGPIRIDDGRHTVEFNDELIDLSKTEYRLLWELASRPEMVLSKEYLLESVWGIDFENNSTVVDTYISYLRKKLHKDGFEGIQTVRGIGFKLALKK